MSTSPGELCYRCNICGLISSIPMSRLEREARTCPAPECGSTPRFRSIIRILTHEIFGYGVALPDVPVRKDIRGLGMSDWFGYAAPLAEKMSYQNTFLHAEPRLDIRDLRGYQEGYYDFVISSEVFEHVAPPVSLAFENCRRLLKPGGLLILTTPNLAGPGLKTREHFPGLHDYQIAQTERGTMRLTNRTRSGELQVFDDLVFHEGPGLALEMRVFSEESLLHDLQAAGFYAIQTRREPSFEFGVYWAGPHSWPITARR